VHALEEAVEQFHGITSPWHVTTTGRLQRIGRGWQFIPEAALFLTGFLLGKDIE
jgi:hypothetical protein